MYKPERLLERELRFTQAYRSHLKDHKATREFYALEQQIPYYFTEPKAHDLLAGRINPPPMIGFFPCMEGKYGVDRVDKVGYAFDEGGCMEAYRLMQQDPAFTPEDMAAVEDMLAFWRSENTNTKIRSRIRPEYAAIFHTDNYIDVSSALHPIYRIAGPNLDFKKLYRYGLSGLIKLLNDKAEQAQDADQKALYWAMAGVLGLLKIVLGQYAEEAQRQLPGCQDASRRAELEKMRDSLIYLQDNPPANFRDALQLQTVYMLAGRSVEIGRLDDYMSEIYMKTLKDGSITRQECVRLLDNFFSIIQEERGRDTRAIIGGFGRENPEAADEFALLVLDVLELRQFNFYPQVSLRYYKGMNEAIYHKSLELLGKGYPFPLIYNDDINVPSVMRAMDVSKKIAEQYTFFGCGEYMLSGLSIGTPNVALNISKVLELAMHNGKDPMTGVQWGPQTGVFDDHTSFDAFMDMFKAQLDYFCDASGYYEELIYDVCNEECSLLLISMLQNDCIERGKGLLDGGIYHLGGTVETYGNVTAYDSVSAIKAIVYDKKLISPERLLTILAADFEGYEAERARLKNAPKFGNDDACADRIASELHEYICNGIRRQRARTRLDSFLVVIINNSMNVLLGRYVGATPDGRKSGDYMSNGNSPFSGCDREGLTALLNSMAKLDTSIHAGGNQNLKVSSSFFKDDFAGIKSLISGFFAMGGQQLNLSVVNQADLEDAMVHPERHENLVVRVGGFSARFVHLEPDVQRDILSRTAY